MHSIQREGSVQTVREGGISVITFTHPAQNSLPGYLLRELTEHIRMAGEDAETQLIILQSGGDRTFCAGASFTELAAIGDEAAGHQFFMGFANVIEAIRTCPKLVIGRVQGKAVGGGVGLASASFVIGPAVERKIGLSAFSMMALDAGKWQSADWAREKGLFMEVFESIEELDKAIGVFTQDLLGKNPEALHHLKRIFWEGTDHWPELLSARAKTSGTLILSDIAQSAIRSFLQKL
ncbi:MAG: enoyl-CoA hydratase/isomerase family protein [Saprospiraceae bacterium]|nr:enoyl-CoA hydratase/isomerase family protein [Saprospiraceae bacterium]